MEGEEREEDGEVDGDWIFVTQIFSEEEWISSAHIHSQRLAEEAQKEKRKKSMEEMVPVHYLEQFQEVSKKDKFDKLPEHHQWDHAIKLVPGTKPFSSKIYPLNLDEQKRLDEFLEENLQPGRIRPLKPPIASPSSSR